MRVRAEWWNQPQVTAIDRDQASIDLTRRHNDDGAGIDYLVGDFLTHPFEPASFDVIASVVDPRSR